MSPSLEYETEISCNATLIIHSFLSWMQKMDGGSKTACLSKYGASTLGPTTISIA